MKTIYGKPIKSQLWLLLLCITLPTGMDAQIHLKANLQNMHLWRGMEVADGMVLTTDLSADLNKHFKVGVWGGMNSSGSYKEFNYYASFTYGRCRFSVWDTYNFSPDAAYNNKEIFNYRAKETGRFIDVTASYTVSERIPLTLSWSTVLFGRDRDGRNAQNRYSTFVYAEYPVWKNDVWEIKPGIGGAFALSPGKDADGKPTTEHFYGKSAGIVHLSLTTTYQLTVCQREFPLTLVTLWNPQSNKGYLQIGVQLLSF